MGKLSILYPYQESITYAQLPEESWHDTGMDMIVNDVTKIKAEQALLRQVMINLTFDKRAAAFRSDVFEDLLGNPHMTEKLMKLLDHIKLLNDYGAVHRYSDDAGGVWDLLHRLDEIGDYIKSVEAIRDALSEDSVRSEGLKNLKEQIDVIYRDNNFGALKKDVEGLNADTRNLKSVTVGVNLNERFEAVSFGLISVNNKYFTKSGVLRHFADELRRRDDVKNDTEWKDDYTYVQAVKPSESGVLHTAETMIKMRNPLLAMTMSSVPAGDNASEITRYMENPATGMLSMTCRRLREVLAKYINVSIRDIADLIPELTYYVRWAEWIRDRQKAGCVFCKPCVTADTDMSAKGFYNLKLTGDKQVNTIVPNDLSFSAEKRVFILTGANRGGKTTVTQAVGQLFILAQGGIRVPAEKFEYIPVDGIYTHFPADEDKTLDLGRLGEECARFRELYLKSTAKSLLLLNETFSTTSFEEGFYIAADAVRAVLKKGTRTIYNTHMHALANEMCKKAGAVSLIVRADNGERSFKIEEAPPEGLSRASDIAEKYGVTFEALTKTV